MHTSARTQRRAHAATTQRDIVRHPQADKQTPEHEHGRRHSQTRFSTSILTPAPIEQRCPSCRTSAGGMPSAPRLSTRPSAVSRLVPAHLISSVCPCVCLLTFLSDYFQAVCIFPSPPSPSACFLGPQLNLPVHLSALPPPRPLHRVSVWKESSQCLRQLT